MIAITPPGSPSRVRSYNLTVINSRMDSPYRSCVVGNSGNNNILWHLVLFKVVWHQYGEIDNVEVFVYQFCLFSSVTLPVPYIMLQQ